MTPDDDITGGQDSVPEHRERVAEAASALEVVVNQPVPDRRAWAEGLRCAVVELINALVLHIDETEQQGGLYDEVVTEKPRLVHAVDTLRREHVALIGDAAALMQVSAVPSSAIDESRLHDDAISLVKAVEKHQRRGLDLLYDFYEVDLGLGE